MHSYQPCPQDYCTNIQYNPQDGMLRILLLIGVIYDTRNRDLLTIHFSGKSSWEVLYNPPSFLLERYVPTTTFVLLFIISLYIFLNFVSYTLFLTFTLTFLFFIQSPILILIVIIIVMIILISAVIVFVISLTLLCLHFQCF